MTNYMCDLIEFDGENFTYTQDLTTSRVKDVKQNHMLLYFKTKKFNSPDELYNQRDSISGSKFIHISITLCISGETEQEFEFREDILSLFTNDDYYEKIFKVVRLFMLRVDQL